MHLSRNITNKIAVPYTYTTCIDYWNHKINELRQQYNISAHKVIRIKLTKNDYDLMWNLSNTLRTCCVYDYLVIAHQRRVEFKCSGFTPHPFLKFMV